MRLTLLAPLLFAPLAAIAQTNATLSIDTAKPIAKVSPTLYGIMSEEINYSYDGGLYAELVNNRTFQTMRGPNLEHWTLIQNGDSHANLELDKTTGPSAAITHSLKLTVTAATTQADAGFYNTGYWGMALHPNTEYQGSFYAKGDNTIGPITLRLVSDTTGAAAATTTIPALTDSWQQYKFTLKTGTILISADNHLEILAQNPGTAWFTLISALPTNLQKTNPTASASTSWKNFLPPCTPAFLRFPGGNYLEGDHLNEHFEWKKTIGPLVDRPTPHNAVDLPLV